MKKYLLLPLILLFVSAITMAQAGKESTLNFGMELNMPLNTTTDNYGNTRNFYQHGVAANFKLELPLTTSLHYTSTAGLAYYPINPDYAYYTVSPGGAVILAPTSYYFIPVKEGLQYYCAKYFYFGAEVGAAIATRSASTTSFIYSGGAGVVIPFSELDGLDVSLRYERGYKLAYYPSPLGEWNIRLAYKFKL